MIFNERMSEVLAAAEEQAFTRSAESKKPARPRVAHFSVEWRFEGTTRATITVDLGSRTIEVRPYKRRRAYTLPLADVAQMVVERIAKAEAAEKRAARKSRARR